MPPAATKQASPIADPEFELTPEQLDLFGEELDALRARVLDDLGQRDADYINKVLNAQRVEFSTTSASVTPTTSTRS